MFIRKAENKDISRIAEILVYNYRASYFPVFNDEKYSFCKIQVLSCAEEYKNKKLLDKVYVYDDGVVKGFVQIGDNEIEKLYVDSFFHGCGIGAKLISFAKDTKNADFLWVLEKNVRAIKFYTQSGFFATDERLHCENTDEFMIKMVKIN